LTSDNEVAICQGSKVEICPADEKVYNTC